MRDQEWDSAFANLYSLDLAQLELRLFTRDPVNSKTTLGVIYQTKVLASLLNGDHIHEADWVCSIGPYFAVDFKILD